LIGSLTLRELISLGIADSVNPCTLGVMTVMLIAILTYNPEKRRRVLSSGMAFTGSVYFMYLFYGLAAVKFWQIIKVFTIISPYLYKILGIAAIILGAKDIYEFIKGGASCSVVPVISNQLQKIASPGGAAVLGALVSVFLLPCTIGPYVILTGMLSILQLINTLPYLLFYNAIFVLPMVMITLIVYFGLSTIDDISLWQAKNMKYLNLTAGVIMAILGVIIFLGLL
jgi:cytochrome c biogenesis protein CcdA